MITSMTGYGDAEASHNGVSYALEIRSVNHRYFKAMIKVSERLLQFEPDIERCLRARLGRGSINYQLKIRSTTPTAGIQINTSLVQSYLEQLSPLVTGNVSIDLAALLALPGVCTPADEAEQSREQLWSIIEELTNKAIHKLVAMRKEEGRAIAEDLLKHSRAIREQANIVAQRAPGVVTDYRDRLTARVNELLKGSNLEVASDDLMREIAVFAERCDISEEISRLVSHLDQFEQLIESDDHAGRKLEFMAQEMLREANTMGSKANDANIARSVVEMKGLIDRLKEQVQNVE